MTSHLRSFEVRKWERRSRRAAHVRRSVFGTAERPRLTVYRSHRHFHAQLIDDFAGRTLAAASTEQKDVLGALKHGGDRKAAAAVGAKLAERAKTAGVTKVVFDRNLYRFHGRVRAFAEAAAKGGLDFLLAPKKKGKPPKVKAEKPKEAPKAAKEKPPKKEGRPPAEKKPEGGGKPEEKKG
jgi:large subunit ribosomal protein L18